MNDTTPQEWWTDYEDDESILADLYHSLHLELDGERDQLTPPPTALPSVILIGGAP